MKDKDIFPQSAEELQKEAQSIRESREEEQHQAEIILNEFLTAAMEIKKICLAYDYTECVKCPFYERAPKMCTFEYSINVEDTPNNWEFDD